jgi:prefoldin subunit 5
MKSQQEYIKEIETKKRKLEDEIDSINEELTRIKAQGNKIIQFIQSFTQSFH